MGRFRLSRQRWSAALLLVFVLLAAGCAKNSAQVRSEPEREDNPAAENTTSETALPPAAVTVLQTSEYQSFAIEEVMETPTAMLEDIPTSPTKTQPSETLAPLPSSVSSPVVEATPFPTFTPPPEPESSPSEHLWFARPVPQGSTVWTDKAYPYGSTRGGTLSPHHGVEFEVPAGTEVLAVADGVVRAAGEDSDLLLGPANSFYGTVVAIEHGILQQGQPVYTLYGHLSEALVAEGEEVRTGDVIGLSGASGIAEGPHLHFEVRVGENSYQSTRNPLLWLYPFPDHGVVAGRITWPDGSPAYEVPLVLDRIDAPSPYSAATTYAEGDINSDEGFQENFVFDDVSAGNYLLKIGEGESKVETALWVYPYKTTFVEIALGG